MANIKQDQSLIKMVKCLNENKMSSAVKYLNEAVNENIKGRILKILKAKKNNLYGR